MKIVIDTNVLVSALLNPSGKPADILNLALNEKIVPCFDDSIIDEYRGVLSRRIFGFSQSDVDSLIAFLETSGDKVDPLPLDLFLDDMNDVKFYEVLESSGAGYLVTGNMKHFVRLRDRRIVLPADFLKAYFSKS